MNTTKLLREISEYGFSKEDLVNEYNISESTLANYSKKQKAHVRSTPQARLIEVLHYALTAIASHQGVNPKKELSELRLAGWMSFNDFIVRFNKDDIDHLKMTIKTSIDSRFKDREFVKSLDVYKEKYKHFNDETLEVATYESPDLLQGIILDEKIPPIARAHTLYALSFGAREDHFAFIKGFVNHASPFIRESAWMGLFQYYNKDEEAHLDLKKYFNERLKEEKAVGVKKKISSLLEKM